MVVVTTASIAGFSPAADIAMLDQIGISIAGTRVGRSGDERALCPPKIGRVIGKAVLLRLKVRPRRHDVHIFRRAALHVRQQFGVETELKNGARFRFAR